MATLSGIITPTNVETASSTSTLTNKTINGSNNTITNVPLSTGVTGTLPIANGGTGSTSTTFANLATNVTGTLPVANGGTGLTSLGTAAQVLRVNAGATALEFATPATPASGLTLLATATASTSATIDLETGIGSTYDHYVILYEGVRPDSGSFPFLQIRLKVGGSYQTSNYGFTLSSITTSATDWSFENFTSSNAIEITRGLGNNSDETAQGTINFSLPTSSAFEKAINGYGNMKSRLSLVMGQYQGSDAALTGVRFLLSSGNILVGNFRLYGYQKT